MTQRGWRRGSRWLGVSPIAFGVALSLCVVGQGYAQEVGRVEGRVITTIPEGNREAVPGVTVSVAELGVAAISDDAGRFELRDVPEGEWGLRADLLGCPLASRTIAVLPHRVTQVELLVRQAAMTIPGLLVEAAPTRVTPQTDEAFSVGRVDIDEDSRARSIADIIRDAFPGVTVLSQNGLAGQEISIQIRGPTSITRGSQPLMVVDGVITTGGVVDLNPDDVASVRVLKGAGASAEYGARGAAGVVEITTGGASADRPRTSGPVVVIDGEVSDVGLGAVDPQDIIETRLLTGTRAAVLFGAGVEERGVLWITTGSARPVDEIEGLGSCTTAPG